MVSFVRYVVRLGLVLSLLIAGSVFSIDRYHEPSFTSGQISVATTSPQRGITRIQFTDPQISTEEVVIGDEQFTDVWIEGESHTTQSGLPSLPIVNRLIGIPDHGAVQLRVIAAEYTEISGVRVYPFQTMEEPSEPEPGFEMESFRWNRQYYQQDTWYPSEVASLGEPAVLRDVRLVSVSICPVQYNPATGSLRIYHNIDVQVEPAPGPGINEKTRSFDHPSSLFTSMYQQLENYQYLELDQETTTPGTYLIICANHATPISFADEIAQWKRRKGIPTRIATRAETGNTYSEIRTFIQNFYNTSDPPLEFVLLLGDDTGNSSDPFHVPSTGGYGGSDHPYGQVAGNDILMDIAVGRLSAGDTGTMDKIVTKTLRYDQDPYVTGPDWFRKAYLLAGTTSWVSSTANTMYYIRHQMFEEGFTQAVLHTHSGHINAALMRQQLNEGRSFFLWRGAYIGEMSSSDLNGLSNGWMMPFVFVITCGTGNFAGSGAGLSEAWLRYGSVSNGGGAVVCVGTATSNTHTRFNNIIAAGIGHGFFVTDNPEAGVALMEAKYQLYRTYYPHNAGDVNNFSHWNNLMGEPGLKIWTASPTEFDVTYPSTIPLGMNRVPVLVRDEFGDLVDGALVCLMKGDETWTRALTDEYGYLEMPTAPNTTGTLWITVSKTNYLTYAADISITQQPLLVAASDAVIDDDNLGGTSGNNDGELNPGETADLTITARNFGSSQTATNVVGTLSSFNSSLAQVAVNQQSFPNIAPGASVQSQGDYRIIISPYAQDQDLSPLLLEFVCTQRTDTSLVPLPVISGRVEFESHQFLLSNNRLDPGETEQMQISVTNEGHRTVTNVQGHLFSSDPMISFPEPNALYGTLTMGASCTNSGDPFLISANPLTIPGHPAYLGLAFTGDDGFIDTTYLRITVGSPATTDPTGPDNYGYYCFDNTDINYEMVPEYQWIDIHTSGTRLPLYDNAENADDSVVRLLPFPFEMYGIEYDSITVCSNGWAALGNQGEFVNFRNHPIPGPHGPDAMMAALWDDLVMSSGGVYWQYFPEDDILVIEWYNVRTRVGSYTETFEIILYNTATYPTLTGDGFIKFQYQTVTDAPGSYDDNDYVTVGIEDHTQLDGLQVTYWHVCNPGAASLTTGRAYLFTNMLSFDVGCFQGQVTDAETGNPIPDALINVENVYFDTTNAQGNFFIPDIIVNEYGVTCSKFGYNDAQAVVEITADDTTDQDFVLTHPEFLMDIEYIQEELIQGDTTNIVFHVDNQGNGELAYEITLDYHVSTSPFSTGSSIGTQQQKTVGPVQPLNEIDDPWESLLLFDVSGPTNDTYVQGVAYAWSCFWVAGGGTGPGESNKIYKFDPQGNYLGEMLQPSTSEYGFRDLTWDGEHLWGSEDQYIVAFDSNGIAVDSIQGLLNPNRVLAYDPDEDVFYTGDITAPIYVLDREGNEIRQYAGHGRMIYGLAWFRDDPDGYPLYMFCQEGNGPRLRVHKLNTSTGDIQFVYDLDGGASDRAGGAVITGAWNPLVWAFVGQVMGQSFDQVGVWELGPNTAWINYSPSQGSISGGSQETFHVLLDGREVLPSSYHVNLVFNHNAIGSPDTLPVSLTVTGVAVDPEEDLIPFEYSLSQNYPNPFNPVTTIPYSLRENTVARLILYNILGQKVRTLVNEPQEAGPHRVVLDARTLASGIYFYRLEAGSFTKIRKMILLK